MSKLFFRKDHAADEAGASAQSHRKTVKESVKTVWFKSDWSDIAPRIIPPLMLWVVILSTKSEEGGATFSDSLAYIWQMIAG